MNNRDLYLGSDEDPRPVFRDEEPGAHDWPEDAVMAITFTAERFSHLALRPGETLPQTEFFGSDGWPIDLPQFRKISLPAQLRKEFQIEPHGWRFWNVRTWQRMHRFPDNLACAREQSQLIHGILQGHEI